MNYVKWISIFIVLSGFVLSLTYLIIGESIKSKNHRKCADEKLKGSCIPYNYTIENEVYCDGPNKCEYKLTLYCFYDGYFDNFTDKLLYEKITRSKDPLYIEYMINKECNDKLSYPCFYYKNEVTFEIGLCYYDNKYITLIILIVILPFLLCLLSQI